MIRLRLIQASVCNPFQAIPLPQPNIYVETVGVARTTCLAYTSMTGGRSNFALCALCAKRTKTEERVRGVKKRKRSWSKPWTADCSSGGLTPAKKKGELAHNEYRNVTKRKDVLVQPSSTQISIGYLPAGVNPVAPAPPLESPPPPRPRPRPPRPDGKALYNICFIFYSRESSASVQDVPASRVCKRVTFMQVLG